MGDVQVDAGEDGVAAVVGDEIHVHLLARPEHIAFGLELDPVKRADLIQQMHKIFVNDGPYAVLYKYDNLQAFRSDRWQNFVRQPAEVGPIMFTQTSSAYLDLEPVSGASSSSGGGANTIVVIGVALVVAGVVFTLVRGRRKKSADDRA